VPQIQSLYFCNFRAETFWLGQPVVSGQAEEANGEEEVEWRNEKGECGGEREDGEATEGTLYEGRNGRNVGKLEEEVERREEGRVSTLSSHSQLPTYWPVCQASIISSSLCI
jgi:hypothetical protein